MDQPETLTADPLRILLIINLPWDARLGAVRVCLQVMECWRAAGHRVEKFSFDEAFPKGSGSGAAFSFRQVLFARKAAAFVRQNAHRFDVVDAIVGSLHGSKEQLHFDGLLVARSIGLPRLYERLHPRHHDPKPRGSLAGRIVHPQFERWFLRAADAAVRAADLVNLPNDEEAACLRADLDPSLNILVQPYGLTNAQHAAFDAAAAPARDRLAAKTISFIGMWGPRKGALEWPQIMRHIWQSLPETRFRFLGTMADKQKVLADLGQPPSGQIELVTEYASDELPRLLSDCSVGIFPSYVEGFGLAVVEQLAAGLPTVAFDAPGPRQILHDNGSNLLTPPGRADAIAERAVEILRMDLAQYDALSRRCREIANQFRWEKIAHETAERYRRELARRRCIVFTQPFSVPDTVGGGGGRILRSLLRDAPYRTLCVCTSPEIPQPRSNAEIYLPIRPFFGRIEHTRFALLPNLITPLFRRHFTKSLEQICRSNNAVALHAVAHGDLDFHHAWRLTKKLRIPFFLQVHDDTLYTGGGRVPRRVLSRCLQQAWLEADLRFVVSDELGEEYNRRYGAREFVVVGDGIDHLAPAPRPAPRQLRIYFMGLFHIGYEENLQALSHALDLVAADLPPGAACSITLRCGGIRARVQHPRVRVLPFGSEAEVQSDFADADWLYLPLHFDEAARSFVAYSLSTKMVTYLGSGIPILYHGPKETAAYRLLSEHRAAVLMNTLDPEEIAQRLRRLLGSDESSAVAANALELARQRFLRTEQHKKFWRPIAARLQRAGEVATPA